MTAEKHELQNSAKVFGGSVSRKQENAYEGCEVGTHGSEATLSVDPKTAADLVGEV